MKISILCCVIVLIWVQTLTTSAKSCETRKEQFQQFVNSFCPQVSSPPRTCADVTGPGSRVVAVLEGGLEVLCDTETDGGGWIVIQRRASADVDFYRTWLEYKYGFGDLEGNFWFGNEKISQLTNLRRYKLRIDLVHSNVSYFAEYDRFRLTGEDDKYRIQLGAYSGNSSDGLDYHNNRPFTTRDRDNDEYGTNCATQFHGAWWYGACHNSNLNGLWGSTEYAKGLTWHTTTGDYATPSFTEMKIRHIG